MSHGIQKKTPKRQSQNGDVGEENHADAVSLLLPHSFIAIRSLPFASGTTRFLSLCGDACIFHKNGVPSNGTSSATAGSWWA